MNVISCDDKFVWWILMFGYLQLRKWDPGINWLDKLCGKAFSLKGVQCKNGTLELLVLEKLYRMD